MFEHTSAILNAADIAMGNSEGVYADETVYPPSAVHQMVVATSNAVGLRGSGLRAIACANNHIVDGGHAALLTMLDLLRELGIETAGAGASLAAARRPAILEARGRRVGFLNYTSVFPKGYEARDDHPDHPVPGVAPLRVSTFYDDPAPNMWLPGNAPRIRTVHWGADLDAMLADVRQTAAAVDVLVVAIHQGNSQVGGFALDEYERVAMKAAADAGATICVALGHHHSLRGAEIYHGVPIFYGLGNFAYDVPNVEEHFSPSLIADWRARFGDLAFGPREGYPTYPFPASYRNTAIGLVSIGSDGQVRMGFVPAEVQPDGRPKPYLPDSTEGERVSRYIQQCMGGVGSEWRVVLATESLLDGVGMLEVVAEVG